MKHGRYHHWHGSWHMMLSNVRQRWTDERIKANIQSAQNMPKSDARFFNCGFGAAAATAALASAQAALQCTRNR